MRSDTKKLTTAAVCTALGILFCACTAYLPLSVMPLYLAAFCIFLACKRGNIVYGILCALALIGVLFAMAGLSVSWFFLLFMFAPYGILAYFGQKLTYFKAKSAILRGVFAVLFFNITLFIIYIIAVKVATVGLDIDISGWAIKLGGYAVLAVVGTLVLLPLDFIFSVLSDVVVKKLFGGRKREKPEPSPEDVGAGGPRYDIFGYEILPDRRTRNDDKSDNDSASVDNSGDDGGDLG